MIAATSIAAYRSLSVGPLRDEILAFIESAGKDGVISDDVFDFLATFEHKNDSSVTTRYSELVREGRIYRAGDTRPGRSGRQQMVMRHAKFKELIPPMEPKPAPKSSVFKKGADWGLRRAAKILLANPIFRGTPEVRAIVREIKELDL